jgi:hypothetical protein
MPWDEVISELERKLIETLKGTFIPMDGIPFFRVLYPPKEEREALRQFKLLSERLDQQGWRTVYLSLTKVMKEALASLFGCKVSDLIKKLKEEEKTRDRTELQNLLAQHLPHELANIIIRKVESQEKCIIFLVRTGVLFPFIRPSHLLIYLENKIKGAVVMAYPGKDVGAFLDSEPGGLYGGYYRGEIIQWR